jgi:hypothetical protein
MLDWLKKLGGGTAWKNSAGLDNASVALLAEAISPLETISADLPADVMRYVLDGDGEDVLGRLAGIPGTGEALGLGWLAVLPGKAPNLIARAQFFETVTCRDHQFFLRLGKTFEAATRAGSSKQTAPLQNLSIVPKQPAFGDLNLKWLEILLVVGTRLALNSFPRTCQPCPALDAELIEAMLVSEGHPPDLLIRTAFLPQIQRFGGPPLEAIFTTLRGLPESAVRHQGAVMEALNHSDFKQRVYALEMMQKCKVPAGPFAAKLVDLAVESSKQVREQAEVLLPGIAPALRPLLEQKIRTGENEERPYASRLLWKCEGEGARAFLSDRLTQEKNKKVIQAIQDLVETSSPQSSPDDAHDALRLPELPPIPERGPLGPETERAWSECFEKVNSAVERQRAENLSRVKTTNLNTLSPDVIAMAFRGLQEPGDAVEPLSVLFRSWYGTPVAEALKVFWQRPELQPIHLVRFVIQIGALQSDRPARPAYVFWFDKLFSCYRRTHADVGIRELAAAFTAAGLDAAQIGAGLLNRHAAARSPFGLPPAQIWPYWAEHLDLLEQAFAPKTADFMRRYQQRNARAGAFEALAAFPVPAKQLLPLLWDLALGPKSERPQAQRCLEGASDKLERLTAALSKGSVDVRMAAAEWLGKLGDKRAIDVLLIALKREANETAKGVMMTVLEQLGAPVDQFLDRASLVKEAEKGIAKGVPEDLKWFPFDQMPVVHWQDTGQELQPIVRWWLIQGFKLKNPEPGPLLRRYCASLKTSQRESLGQFILEAWIAEDVVPISRDDAEKRARTHGQQMAQLSQYVFNRAQTNPQAQPTAPPPLTAEQYYAQALPGLLKQPKGSAISSKGVLSVAGACLGAAAAPIVNRYLKEWYGQRAAQCKALLQMLAWVENRTATQLLLAVGSRFRTKGIQEEANKQAEAVAERKGWTIAELADRTIPSAGLDENGIFTIDYGPRQFTARLNEDLDFALTDAEGKTLKALPEPRKDDDEAKAAEAKKAFSAARKELKSVMTMQRDRLYEAMCTQRTWSFEDWNLYLNQHPIVKHYCQRLVWAVIRDEKAVNLFRPLPDGSLTDAADDPVELKDDDPVRVAHECQVTAEESQTWRQHLRDYNVEALFEQFGRASFTLPEERESQTDIDDFQGHVLEAFRLRGRATKLGYTRGQAQDGGWFFDYRKRFPTLGIEAVIEFTGNGLPEENRTVGLTILHFDRVVEGESFSSDAKMTLSEAPPVLVSECWNDVRAIAAEGPGFDPEWEKKTQP